MFDLNQRYDRRYSYTGIIAQIVEVMHELPSGYRA